MERFREDEAFINDEFKEALARLFGVEFDCPAPNADDIARLCHEPGLDYVIVHQEFPGLVAAGNDRIFIYECQQVRAALPRPGSSPAPVAATGSGSPLARAPGAP